MPTSLLTYRGLVYPWHCDHMGHMNVMWYVGKFDEATWQLCSAIGCTPSYLRQSDRAMAAVDQRICYRKELHAGDAITIRSAIVQIRERTLRFVHEMTLDESNEHVATTILTAVQLDGATRRACPLPAPIIAAARTVSARTTPWDAWPPARAFLGDDDKEIGARHEQLQRDSPPLLNV
jgi:acyl-CoA thioester hydrolase